MLFSQLSASCIVSIYITETRDNEFPPLGGISLFLRCPFHLYQNRCHRKKRSGNAICYSIHFHWFHRQNVSCWIIYIQTHVRSGHPLLLYYLCLFVFTHSTWSWKIQFSVQTVRLQNFWLSNDFFGENGHRLVPCFGSSALFWADSNHWRKTRAAAEKPHHAALRFSFTQNNWICRE